MRGITRLPSLLLLLATFLFASCERQVAGADGLLDLDGLFAGLNQQNEKIQQDIHQVNKQIHENVNAQVAQAQKQAAQAQQHAARIQQDVAETLKNIPKDDGSHLSFTNYGNSQTIVSSGGQTHIIRSGIDRNGKRYETDISEFREGNVLYHTERIYNSTTDKFDETRYKVDLADPNLKRVYYR